MSNWVILAIVIAGMIIPMFVARRLGNWLESAARKLISSRKRGNS